MVYRGVARELRRRTAGSAGQWVRPPYALEEQAFLHACTCCDKCIEACPHQVIYALPERAGRAAGTPALNLLQRGCHLCQDWPCVNACEPGALQLAATDEGEEEPLPRLARASIDTRACLPYSGPECGACAGSCPVPGALSWDENKPVIDAIKCNGCGMCREACIVEPKAVEIRVNG